MRLINAEKLEYSFELSIKSWGRDCNSNAPAIANTYKMALKRVKEEPTIDAVEVVRCRACKYYDIKYGVCDLHSVSSGAKVEMALKDFCSYGERRVEE